MRNAVGASRQPILSTFNQTLRPGLKIQYISFQRSAGQQRRCLRTSRCLAEEKKSFRGQLYESTAQRLARERAEEAKYIENKQKMGPSKALQTFALTIREYGLHTAIRHMD